MIAGKYSSKKTLTEIDQIDSFEIIWSSSSDEEVFDTSKCIKPKEDFFVIEDLSQPSKSSNLSFIESPIIGSCQLSPVLTSSVDEPSSPIIGKKKRKLVFDHSPDLFLSRCTNKIDLPASPSKSELNYEILSVTSEDIKSTEITTFSIDTGSTPFNSTQFTKSSTGGLYFNLSEKRKRFVKGGFAKKADLILLQQKNDSEIFKHEIYLSKHEKDFVSSINEDLFVIFKVTEISHEFGLIIAKEINTALFLNDCFKEKISVGTVLKIYPPYILKKVDICGEIIKVFFNVSKFVTG